MEKLLFVNACLRGEGKSRTHALCKAAIKTFPNVQIDEVRVDQLGISPLSGVDVERRERLAATGDFSHDIFSHARQFAVADQILVGAPYWDLQFPAALKVYLEHVCVTGVTFRFDEKGIPHSLCRAKRLLYVTTAGGYIGEFNLGFDYVRTLARLFHIEDVHCIAAEGLDIVGNDAETIMRETIAKLDALVVR